MRNAGIRLYGVGAFHAALAFLLILISAAHSAEDVESLYTASVVITERLEQERQRGFAAGLEQVLVKVSGDPALAGSPAVISLATRAGTFVADYELRDRLEGIPVHDEQGTRERPHMLVVRFSRQAVDQALRQLGREPWLKRPPIMLALVVEDGANRFVLGRDSELGSAHRAALQDRSEALGLEVLLPDAAMLAHMPLETGLPATPNIGDVETMRKALKSDVLLVGRLIWDAPTFRWHSQWQLATESAAGNWAVTGLSFDSVFRQTLENTMQVLSRSES